MSILEHPQIYWFSATLVVLNVVCLIVSLFSGNAQGIAINFFFLLFNGTAAVGNWKLRTYRKQQRRDQLIQLTIGE